MSRYDNQIMDDRFYNVFFDDEDEVNEFFQGTECDCNCQNEEILHSRYEAAKNLYFSKGYVQGVVNGKEDQELLSKKDWRLCFPMACPCPRKSEEAFLKGLPSDIGAVGPQGQAGEKGEKGEKGDKGEQGEPGQEGPRGATGRAGMRGPKGDPITDYLTANAIAAQNIEEEGAIVYGENTSLGGNNIEHTGNTAEFILAPEHTYYMTLSVSGNSSKQCPFYFSIKLCDEVIGAVHSTIAKGYNGASAYLCFKTPEGIPSVLRIINACGEEVNSINSSIGIMQFA